MEQGPDPTYQNCYAFPALGHGGGSEFGLFRVGGAGLANLLMIWARCLVESRKYGLKRISPTWLQISREQWIRNSPDKRTYHGLFSPSPDEITGLRRLSLLATGKRVPESMLGQPIPDGSTVVFRGIPGFLTPVLPYRELVSAKLIEMTLPAHKRALAEGFSPDVAIHVRRGDFGTGNPASGNTRIDLDWYIGILHRLQQRFGSLTTAVFSDGTDEELAPLLAMEGVSRTTFGQSIADIFGLSQARIFIASGSTFSMWASFLGQMPTIWFPERLPHPILEDPRKEILTFGDLSEEFTATCEASLRRENPDTSLAAIGALRS